MTQNFAINIGTPPEVSHNQNWNPEKVPQTWTPLLAVQLWIPHRSSFPQPFCDWPRFRDTAAPRVADIPAAKVHLQFIYRRFCEAKQFAEAYTVALWKCSFPSSQTMLPVLRLTIIGYIHNEDTCCLYNLTNEITRRSRGDPSEQRCDSQSLPRFDLTLKKSLATSANFFTSCSSNPLAMLTLLTIGLGISLHSLRLSRDHLQPHIRPFNQLLDSSTCTTPITDSRAGCCGRWSVSRNITT